MLLIKEEVSANVLNLIMSMVNDNEKARGCHGLGIIRNEYEADFTVEYNFSFKIIDNETGEEI